jgi:ATP-binding cassette, subfamily A (ABC1), member 3
VAVKDLSLSMYQDQIFVLLGHNGAGKTSTIQMLTGMQNFTSGKATVYNKNVDNDIDEIRKFMGVCPQHDILYEDMTVREHLEMFAVFKGMEESLIPAAVEKAIEDVDLQEKADDLSKNLSGG